MQFGPSTVGLLHQMRERDLENTTTSPFSPVVVSLSLSSKLKVQCEERERRTMRRDSLRIPRQQLYCESNK